MINPDQILIFEYSLGAHTVVDADVLQTVSTIPVGKAAGYAYVL